MLAWGDRMPGTYKDNIDEGVTAERALLAERLPYLAQNTWNSVAKVEYNELAPCAGARGAELDKLIN